MNTATLPAPRPSSVRAVRPNVQEVELPGRKAQIYRSGTLVHIVLMDELGRPSENLAEFSRFRWIVEVEQGELIRRDPPSTWTGDTLLKGKTTRKDWDAFCALVRTYHGIELEGEDGVVPPDHIR